MCEYGQASAPAAKHYVRLNMKIRATPLTASLAGASMAVVINLNGILSSFGLVDPKPDTGFSVIALIFFFASMLLLVVGTDNIKFNIGYPFTREYWQSFPFVIFRMLCWFVSASAAGTMLHRVLKK